ncbi:MAG: condensation domain-containing protein [Vicinamibacterales bacterium]
MSDRFRLTEAQEGLWYAQRIDPSNPTFNTGQYIDLRGPLDRAAWACAVEQALAEADALSVRVVESADGLMQLVDDTFRASLDIVDLRGHADGEQVARERIAHDMETPVDPTRDRLVAEVLFVLADERHWWYQRIHHLVIDGYGTSLLTDRIVDLYAERVGARQARRGALGPLRSVIDDDGVYRASEMRVRDRQFWHDHLAGHQSVPGLADGPAIASRQFRRIEVPLPSSFDDALHALCAVSRTQWPDAMTALVAAYVGRHVGTNDVVVGVPAMQRMGTPAVHVPAMVMNVLPVRVPIDEAAPLPAALRTIALVLRGARKHGRYRGEQVRRDLGLVSQQHRLYSALINVLPFEKVPELPGVSATVHVLGTGPVDDLTVTVRAAGDGRGMRVELDANPTLYDETQLAAHATRLACFLDVATRSARLADVPTLTPAETDRWVRGVNDTAHDVVQATLTELVEQSFIRTPDRIALVSDAETLTYAELDRRTARLARALLDAGVRPDTIVAVALPRSIDLVVALIATLRAGGAYLPIDASHPSARIARIVESSHPQVAVVSADTIDRVPASLPAIVVGRAFYGEVGETVSLDDRVPARANSAAYVIYTSGSTGDPKGVVVEHHAIVNRLEWMRSHVCVRS